VKPLPAGGVALVPVFTTGAVLTTSFSETTVVTGCRLPASATSGTSSTRHNMLRISILLVGLSYGFLPYCFGSFPLTLSLRSTGPEVSFGP